MRKTIMQITDYCIKGLEKQVGYRVCIDDLSIMNEVDALDVCEIIMDIEKEHNVVFSQDISYTYDSVTQFIETLYNAQEDQGYARGCGSLHLGSRPLGLPI